MFRVGVFAVVRDERGHVLLCHRRDHDFWNLPGGGLESGESPWQGVVREVREETGVETRVIRLAGVSSWPDLDEIIFSFECAPVSGELTATDEARAVAYFPPDALPANAFAEHVQRIHDALSGSNEPILRVPDVIGAHEEIRQAHASVRTAASASGATLPPEMMTPAREP